MFYVALARSEILYYVCLVYSRLLWYILNGNRFLVAAVHGVSVDKRICTTIVLIIINFQFLQTESITNA